MAKRYHFAQVAERRKLPRHQTRRALRQKVPAHRSRGIGRDETADFDIAAKTDIPNDGFAKRVSGVANDRLFRHLPPQTIDWNPISSRSHVVLRAMPVEISQHGTPAGLRTPLNQARISSGTFSNCPRSTASAVPETKFNAPITSNRARNSIMNLRTARM
jgi:hypothetical protein